MDYTYETIEINEQVRVRIVPDDHAPNPRKDYDNVATMWCWHGRYDLGDDTPPCEPHEFFHRLLDEIGIDTGCDSDACDNGYFLDDDGERTGGACPHCDGTAILADDKARALAEQHYYILPLYLYEHSGITMSTGRFSCPWDSGQVGWIFCLKSKARKEYGEHADADYYKVLDAEVEEYDQYLTGDVYGYIVEKLTPPDEYGDQEVEDELDSCWGFFGGDYAIEQGKEVGEYEAKELAKAQAKERAEREHWAERDVVTVDE